LSVWPGTATLRAVQQQRGPRPFDVATRFLIDDDPEAWLTCARLPINGPAHVIESDVSTVLAQVDKVLKVDAPSPWLAHIELQVSYDRILPLRLLQYHALLRRRHELPVASVVVLLRQQADGQDVTGRIECLGPTGSITVAFNYEVVRIWERPVDELLEGGIGTLPLAPLARLDRARLPEIIRRIDERLDQEASPAEASQLWAATHLLLGLRYDREEAQQLLQGITRMRESSTYQAILDEGREEGREVGREEGRHEGELIGVRRTLLRMGEVKFGPVDPVTASQIERIDDMDLLDRLISALFRVSSWPELRQLATQG